MITGRIAGLLAGMLLAGLPGVAHALPPSALGPEAILAQPSEGLLGRIAAVPDRGPAGTAVTVTGAQLPPGEQFDLVWRTVTGNWKVEAEHYRGREFTPVGYRIATVTSGADGSFTASFTTPEDFGLQHDIVLQQGTRLLTQTGFTAAMTMKVTPESGPLGTPVTVEVTGIGYRTYENSWTLVYDNDFTGWVSSVTTGGTAKFTVPATGAPGRHVLRLVHAGFTYPYLNPEQSPNAGRDMPRAEFEMTAGEAVLPPPAERQGLAAIRNLPKAGDLAPVPAFSGIGQPVTLSAGGLTVGKTYELNWGAVFGNRIAANGWEERFRPVATATADAGGMARFAFDAPDDLGGAHDLTLDADGKTRAGTYWVTPTALPLAVGSGPAGTPFAVHLKGGGWTETANIYHIDYDNAYLGYACAFNSQGDITVNLTASGAPGWHYIDLYPGIYKGDETQPNNYRTPQLTFAADHPGEDLPAFHFAFHVTE